MGKDMSIDLKLFTGKVKARNEKKQYKNRGIKANQNVQKQGSQNSDK